MSTLKCKECGHENETQRVYCHSCGVRLDRTSLTDDSQKPQKPVKRKSRGDLMGSFASGIKSLLKVAFFAVLAAALVQAVRPPKDAPSENKTIGGDIVDAPSVALDLEEATASPRRFGYSEAQLNAYLKNRVKAPKNPTIPIWAVTFDKAFINLKPGSFRISKKYFVFTLPCYLGGTYLPTIENGVLKFQALSGNIGSLPLPGLLFDQVDQFIFADFIKNMKEEANGAAKMKSIEVTPKMVVITSGSGK